MKVLSAERNLLGKAELADAPSKDYFLFPRNAQFYRIFFLVRASQADHNIALLGGRSEAELSARTETFLAQSKKDCSLLGGGYCLLAPAELAITPEMEVLANGRKVWIPLGGRVRDVLRSAGEEVRALSQLSVVRPFGGRLVPVAFDSSKQDILNLTLIGGERLRW